MWACRHCKEEFSFTSTSDKANHSRWCKANPKRNDWDKQAGGNKTYGERRLFTVVCGTCDTDFQVKEREKKFPSKSVYYCSRNCANSVGGKAKAAVHHTDDVAHYRTVAGRYHKMECLICGFDKIVAVHHVDEDHSNNDPKNLVCLCPNHHEMFHSKYRSEVEDDINNYVENRWALSDNGSTSVLHTDRRGS